MTNEEQAREIAESCYSKRTKDKPANKLGQVIIMQACLKMAEWKEQQMVDKACKAYCKQCDTKECEDFGSDTCNWLQKFKKILEN